MATGRAVQRAAELLRSIARSETDAGLCESIGFAPATAIVFELLAVIGCQHDDRLVQYPRLLEGRQNNAKSLVDAADYEPSLIAVRAVLVGSTIGGAEVQDAVHR